MSVPFANSEFWAFCNSNGQGDHLVFEGIKRQFMVEDLSQHCNWQAFQEFLDQAKGSYVFLALAYDLKNDIEQLETKLPDYFSFPKLVAVVPQNVGSVDSKSFLVHPLVGNIPSAALLGVNPLQNFNPPKLNLHTRFSKSEYLKRAHDLLKAIQLGKLYEVNFCMDFYANDCELNPWEVYKSLNQKSEAPYSVCARYGAQWILSASPEMYLSKKGRNVFSAPIKGTVARGKNSGHDLDLAKSLKDSGKERAENIMIVDLVRNDLSKVAERGSVHVSEICEVKSFKTVHHMVSTIQAKLKEGVSFTDIVKATFPMGSMTGAPKLAAMQFTDSTEASSRGIYSGALGYMKPNGDFDLNVVIRSILYDASKNYLSFKTGSALTAQCDPAMEYEECIIKARALIDSLNGTLDH